MTVSDQLHEQLQAALGKGYVVGRELGGGGMSRVFAVDDLRLGRQIVAKLLAPELAGAVSAERFEREIRVAASLQHANIVPLIDAGDAGGLPFFTMPFVDGQSLRERLASGSPLGTVEIISILRDVARALGYAHERGLVHRDIKPDNVLLSRGAAEVTDFGIAKALDAARVTRSGDTLTQLGTSLGTPAYMSPEQAAGDPSVDHRADIYALGATAYEMIEGRPPYLGTPHQVMAAHVHATLPPIARAEIPAALKKLVIKCLEKNASDRYQSADELLADLERVATRVESTPATGVARRRLAIWFAAAFVVLITGWVATNGMRRERWVQKDALPRIRAYVYSAQYDSAWLVAREVMAVAPRDSDLAKLLPTLTRKAVFKSVPAGATVSRAMFQDTSQWIPLGTTPTDTVLIPYFAFGRLRIEKPGYRAMNVMAGGWSGGTRTYYLDKVDSPDSDMVHIAGGELEQFLVGLDGRPTVKLGDFLMDRHEVTNRQYKKFVDAGAYTRREWWPAEMPAGALSGFLDQTGRPGPATWEAGEYPTGKADFPVSGVSWYEAKAYAKYAGKLLPTTYHWATAAFIDAAKYVVPGSNLDGSGPVRGNTRVGMSPTGVFDMAGNVREWCENASNGGSHYILGGGWTDSPYGFTDAYAQPAMDRSPINGIRLIKLAHDEPNLAAASAPQEKSFRDYFKETAVSDVLFDSYRRMFDYDRAALHARVISRDSSYEDYVRELITFDAAYGNEKMMAYVLTPKRGRPPYQSVIYYPGSGAIVTSSSKERMDQIASFVTKTGRAAVLPILKSTYERQDSLRSDIPNSSIFWRDHVVMWGKDIRRTVDYISSRADMDSTRIAYFGYSWGSNMAPISLAVEPRIKAAIVYVAGLTMERSRPEVDPFNYLPRVMQPVLMLDGKYDFFFPVEPAQKPFFANLGTAADHKKYVLYEGGHDVPRTELMKETLLWLDRYLGRVP